MKDKEKDIIKLFLLIDEGEIIQAERKIKFLKSYKSDKWKIKNLEGM